ncbi:hypothetical protein SNEBB_008690 [Seison nebaliae]|nr:hypothetical protein SNEBB_008690 [Seison nebaliae]
MSVVCQLCYEEISRSPEPSEQLIKISCGHRFHVGCFQRLWNRKLPTCPIKVCARDIGETEAKVIDKIIWEFVDNQADGYYHENDGESKYSTLWGIGLAAVGIAISTLYVMRKRE